MQCNTVLRFRWSATASPVMQSSVSVLPCCRAAGPARQVARPSGRPMEAGTAGGPTARTQPSHSNTSASHPRYTTAALGASPGAGECGDHAARGGPDMNLKYAPLIALAIVTAGCGSTTATTASAGGASSTGLSGRGCLGLRTSRAAVLHRPVHGLAGQWRGKRLHCRTERPDRAGQRHIRPVQ